MKSADLHAVIPDPGSLRGRGVLVTGGTTGIGRAVARGLGALGARVLIFGRNEEDLGDAMLDIRGSGGEVDGVVADVSKLADVRRVFAQVDSRLGDLDILVNNAAVTGEEFERDALETIDYVVRTNVIGYLACAREAVERMRSRRRGHIVLIGSMSADLREEGGSTYVATKGAIQAFAESLRKTVNEEGIRVTLIEPGKVATDLVDGSDEEKRERIREEMMLHPEDVAGSVLYALLQPPRCDIVSLQIRPHRQVI